MNRVYSYRKTIAWSVIMLIAFLFPTDNFSKAPSVYGLSEIIHFVMFAVFTCLFIREQLRVSFMYKPFFRNYFSAIIFSLIFGATIELLQKISGLGRTAELKDLVFDLAGSVFSAAVIMLYFRKRGPGPSKV